MIIKTFWTSYNIEIRRTPKIISARGKFHGRIVNRDYDKVFCIGNHKTGTTSIARVLRAFGFAVGDQGIAEVIATTTNGEQRIEKIQNYCYTAEAFQDTPFMDPLIYKQMDCFFPNSKFILTVRDKPEQWYQSLVKFHTNKFSNDKSNVPDENDLKNALYRYKGWMHDAMRMAWNYPEVPLYDETYYKRQYQKLNEEAIEYFKGRPNDFLQVNVSKKEDFQRLCKFLNVETKATDFPWENKT